MSVKGGLSVGATERQCLLGSVGARWTFEIRNVWKAPTAAEIVPQSRYVLRYNLKPKSCQIYKDDQNVVLVQAQTTACLYYMTDSETYFPV